MFMPFYEIPYLYLSLRCLFMRKYSLLIPAIIFLMAMCNISAVRANMRKLVLNTDTTKQTLQKLEFVTDKYDTIKYTLNQDNLFYTIRRADVIVNHIPPKTLET